MFGPEPVPGPGSLETLSKICRKASKATGSSDKVSDKGPITSFWDKLYLPAAARHSVGEKFSYRRKMQWEGDGPLFQVEKAVSLAGTFQPVGPAQTEKVFTDPGVLRTNAQSFYRVR